MSARARSLLMGKVASKNTKPELVARSLLHRLGYRFRLHRKDLPGKPDVVLPARRTVLFVNGCFWHQHPGCPAASLPKANHAFWRAKLQGNVLRQASQAVELRAQGWLPLVVWECELASPAKALRALRSLGFEDLVG
jgi:DNA mismatch endonuclease (patch repair protein)